ncbi:MAG: hypothetical protein IJL37_10145 [Bacteroidaceae bacterium]|nr:hypothetical protein [Bacteroidaceae bacterium]
MHNVLVKILKTLGIIAAILVVLFVIAIFIVESPTIQNKVMKRATAMLTEKLGRRVEVEKVNISLIRQSVGLYGVEIGDKETPPVLQLERLEFGFELLPLLHKRIVVEDAKIEGVEASWISQTKKGPMDNQAIIRKVIASIDGEQSDVNIQGFHYRTDNHLPRKNENKPKHGAFDPGHFDIMANMKLRIDTISKDTLVGQLLECKAQDTLMGFDIRDLHAKIQTNYKKADIQDLTLQQGNTVLNVLEAELTLPSKKEERTLAFTTGTITARTQLRDIARTFAPPLEYFELSLNLTLHMSMANKQMAFRDIHVTTDDGKLQIDANGDLLKTQPKDSLDLRFHIDHMTAKSGIAEEIINQFSVKKLMMKQLRVLGAISYVGNLNILYKKERFNGVIQTNTGAINANITHDGMDKWMSGRVVTKGFDLGKTMDIKVLRTIDCTADFKIDISKPRTAEKRRLKGGKLPICTVNATVDDCIFEGLHFRHLTADIDSDCAEAIGHLRKNGRIRDLYCTFTFTDTDDMHKMKISKPGIKFHLPVKRSKK